MFKCDECGNSSVPGEKLVTKVVQTRPHKHPQREYKNKRQALIHDRGNEFATQIVREAKVCRTCAYGGSVDKLVEKFNHPVDEMDDGRGPAHRALS
jgi:hypothetical protein